MPSYRGVEQADFIRNVNDALALLETHSTGPVMQQRIDALRAPDANGVSKLGALAAAATDAEFVVAVRGSGLNYLFARVGEVLQFHADENTGGTGAAIVNGLRAWDATGGAMTAEYNKLDEETDSWLIASYARLTPKTEKTLETLANTMFAVSRDKEAVGTAFGAALDLVEATQAGAADADAQAAKIFLALSLHERHIVKTALRAVNAPAAPQTPEAQPAAIGRYGVVIDDLTERRINWTDDAVGKVRDAVEKALHPFYDLDEVQMTGIGMVGDHTNPKVPMGVVFQSSPRAAQAVADALPGMKVVDYSGNIVAPRRQPDAPKPGFTL
jgi:hypothetical protein